ncbi:MAG: aminodeoxychorismate/anthranilate synthase component II [Lachnospiraceae bacterium]|nr:aminodeoxychorismate/anthranilate synthase component II [Lachnospiraceae bacterium]
MILLIDNYDSFSYNLFQMVGAIDPDLKVVRNDELTIDDIRKLNPKGIILSPGPGRPSDAGICEEVVKELKGEYPILGVCLGHQAICESFGATVTYAKELMHGKKSMTSLDENADIFKGLGGKTEVGRYHSLAADDATLPSELKVIARTDDGEVMAVKHEKYNIVGLQFHPESILTPRGNEMLANWYRSLIFIKKSMIVLD